MEKTLLLHAEAQRLQELEQCIEHGLQTFVEVGLALLEIRDSRLYRATHQTFEEYCRERWGFSRSRAHRMIDAAEITGNLLPMGNKLPENERQVRSLAALPSPELQREAWQKAVETAPDGKVTAAHVQRVVDQLTGEIVEPAPREFHNNVATWTEKSTRAMEVHYSSESPEWCTPPEIVVAVIAVLGAIDLDPCSNSHTAPNVPARWHYTKEDDGLMHPWQGRVYMNPPYGTVIGEWTNRLVSEYHAGNTCEAIALLPGRIDTSWFQPLFDFPLCAVRGRLTFSRSDNSAPFPSVVAYLGRNERRFAEVFGAFGAILKRMS